LLENKTASASRTTMPRIPVKRSMRFDRRVNQRHGEGKQIRRAESK
jgi:hypothetical protein